MKQLRILIVEPDEMQLIGMRAALSISGYGCAGTDSTEKAATFLGEHYDLVLIGTGFSETDCNRIAATLGAASVSLGAIVALTELPDCMIGRMISGAKTPPELPSILEALTRLIRFAPPGNRLI